MSDGVGRSRAQDDGRSRAQGDDTSRAQGLDHLWQGDWISREEALARASALPERVLAVLREPLSANGLLDSCDRLAGALAGTTATRASLEGELGHLPERERRETLDAMAAFLRVDSLRAKLERELGGDTPSRPTRLWRLRAPGPPVFESWEPLGILAHIAPTNAASVAALSVVEGLLCGNLNWLKVGGADSLFAHRFLEALASRDPTGGIAKRVIVSRAPSSDRELLRALMSEADGVAVWGGEEAVESIRSLAPPTARFVDWGPKISFAYVSRSRLDDEGTLSALASDCCREEQQACSSPQVAYVEGDPLSFAERFAASLERVSRTTPVTRAPSEPEQAEITLVTELARLESHLGLAHVREGAGWRILVDQRPALAASPLFRTIWVKPLAREEIPRTLRPMRRYLQTAGLACAREEWAELSRLVFAAGALRATPVGRMLESYPGEPHDGTYALPRYARRVSAQAPETLADLGSLDELAVPSGSRPRAIPGTQPAERERSRDDGAPSPAARRTASAPVLDKEAFQRLEVPRDRAHLFFKSGGSSGAAKLSVFSYRDYHAQMRAAARGLVAAGFDPGRDRAMNLFFAGGLYGGFLSFFTILEELQAPQLPMAAHPDHAEVARAIVEHEADTLLGMPSYLAAVLRAGSAQLRGRVRKIFFGGEHLGRSLAETWRRDLGVELIRSAAYGSVDAGPLGFQCGFCEGTIHHLQDEIQALEILHPERDEPAETGRLVFTSLARESPRIERYDVGDLGRWMRVPCPCGRSSPRFELLGRSGDVCRIGATFLNLGKLERILEEAGFSGQAQLELDEAGGRERARLLVQGSGGPDLARLRALCLLEYRELREAVEEDRTLVFEIEARERLESLPGSGKLKRVIDRRDLRGSRA